MSTDKESEKKEVPVVKACGIDFGTSEIAVAISSSDAPFATSLVRNFMANETTPGVVKMYRNKRTYGEEAAATATLCPQNVYSHLPIVLTNFHLLSGLKDRYPDLCFSLREDSDKRLVLDVLDDADVSEVSLTHVISMLFRYLFRMVTKDHQDSVENTVIALPAEVPQEGVRAVVDAATLAGFKNIQIIPTNVAQAYNYCFRMTTDPDFPKEGERNILFVDQGSCFTDLYVVRVSPAGSEIACSVSRQFGAKDVDRALYDHFVKKLMDRVTIVPHSKQSIRLMNGCCHLKEMLSAATKAVFTVDGLIDGDDYQLSMTRAELEGLVQGQIDSFKACVNEIRSLFPGKFDAVEMIGGGSRIPFMQSIVSEVIGEPLRFTVDSASCIAKGCALLGIYDSIKTTMAMTISPLVPSAENPQEMERLIAVETKLRDRDAAQEALGEAHNALEAFIDQMRRELTGDFAKHLDADAINPLLDAESDWLWNEGESASLEELKSRLSALETTLREEFAGFYEAKEKHRLDVERQLEEESKKREQESVSDDVKLPYSARMARAEANKKEGNELFKGKNYEMAVQRYMRALGHCSKFFNLSPEQKESVADLEKSIRLNLAQCFIKLGGWNKAIDHCTSVLKTDPQNAKALYRRAFCYDKLKDIEKCSADLEVVLKLIPDDPSVKNLASRNSLAKKQLQDKRRAMAKKMFGGL